MPIGMPSAQVAAPMTWSMWSGRPPASSALRLRRIWFLASAEWCREAFIPSAPALRRASQPSAIFSMLLLRVPQLT